MSLDLHYSYQGCREKGFVGFVRMPFLNQPDFKIPQFIEDQGVVIVHPYSTEYL